MIKTLMYHKVQDFNKWKEAFESFAEARKAAGELNYSIGTLHNEPNTAYVINSWENIKQFEAFVGADELKAAMREAGVLEAPHTIILEETNNG